MYMLRLCYLNGAVKPDRTRSLKVVCAVAPKTFVCFLHACIWMCVGFSGFSRLGICTCLGHVIGTVNRRLSQHFMLWNTLTAILLKEHKHKQHTTTLRMQTPHSRTSCFATGKSCVTAMVEEALIEPTPCDQDFILARTYLSLFVIKCLVLANGDNEKETISCHKCLPCGYVRFPHFWNQC